VSDNGSCAEKPACYGPDQFQAEFGISDDVRQNLAHYAALLDKWQRHINLVSKNSLAELWQRHMRDSAQLTNYVDLLQSPWLDIGSGAGFPGLVMAILLSERLVSPVQLVESDARKSVFLREVIRVTRAPALVHNVRVENLSTQIIGGHARIITARALASVHGILELTGAISNSETVYLLLKGQDIDDELTSAAKYRKMTVKQHPSRTASAGKVLILTEVDRV